MQQVSSILLVIVVSIYSFFTLEVTVDANLIAWVIGMLDRRAVLKVLLDFNISIMWWFWAFSYFGALCRNASGPFCKESFPLVFIWKHSGRIVSVKWSSKGLIYIVCIQKMHMLNPTPLLLHTPYIHRMSKIQPPLPWCIRTAWMDPKTFNEILRLTWNNILFVQYVVNHTALYYCWASTNNITHFGLQSKTYQTTQAKHVFYF